MTILEARMSQDPPQWQIRYEVRNQLQAPIWLVVDESVKLEQDGGRIALSLARGRMRPAAHVFGYFAPQVVRVEPREAVEQIIQLAWPPSLSDLWHADPHLSPAPGNYDVVVRVGYGLTGSPSPLMAEDDVEDSVLSWQQVAVSDPVVLEVPPYETA